MKNRLLKNFICIMLTVLLVFGTAATAFAQDEIILPEETTTEQPPQEEPTVPEEPADPDEPEADENKIVAKASLFMAMYVFPVSAHSWIYVENLSDEPITVGIYEVPAGQGVSVGTFSFSVRDGWGIYYNLEAYRENLKDRIDKCWSITKDMTAEELEKLSRSIKNYPNMWDIFIFNCTFFSFSIWNSNTNYFFLPFMIPAIPLLEMMIMGAKKGETPMYFPTTDQLYRQRGTGNSAYLEHASDDTINH